MCVRELHERMKKRTKGEESTWEVIMKDSGKRIVRQKTLRKNEKRKMIEMDISGNCEGGKEKKSMLSQEKYDNNKRKYTLVHISVTKKEEKRERLYISVLTKKKK